MFERPKRVLSYKTYNSIPHLSGSRLGESDSTIDNGQEKFLTKEFPPVKCYLWVEEKMDGSNVCVVRHKGELVALGRSGYDCKSSNLEQHRMFHKWVMLNKDKFKRLLPREDERVVGEWLALAHGTRYKQGKDFTQPFMAFDLFCGDRQQSVTNRRDSVMACGLENVPLLYEGMLPISIEEALRIASVHNPYGEGVIYRLEKYHGARGFSNRPWIIAKVVKHGKEDGKYFKGEFKDNPQWNYRLD